MFHLIEHSRRNHISPHIIWITSFHLTNINSYSSISFYALEEKRFAFVIITQSSTYLIHRLIRSAQYHLMLLTILTHTSQLRTDCFFQPTYRIHGEFKMYLNFNCLKCDASANELKFMFGQMCTANEEKACTCSLFYTIVKCNYYVWSILLAMSNERSLAQYTYNKNNQCNTIRLLCYGFRFIWIVVKWQHIYFNRMSSGCERASIRLTKILRRVGRITGKIINHIKSH